MSMSVTWWAEWSEEPEAGIRIGAHSEEVLLRGKPVIEFHHGRSTQGRTSLTTQQPDLALFYLTLVSGLGQSLMY